MAHAHNVCDSQGVGDVQACSHSLIQCSPAQHGRDGTAGANKHGKAKEKANLNARPH